MARWSVPGCTELRSLGSGGFGEVELARHDATGVLVAIKYLRPDLLADREFAQMFRSEAALLAYMDDPNVVRLYEYIESPSGAAIVMELVDGVSLRRILAEQGATTAEAALVVLKGSLLGLAAAHRRGVVHRDYKPENVLINADGTSKLTDFGLAARAGDRPTPAGTLAYVAPEQIDGAPASPASDVYAATATFYECLTGAPPFTGESGELLRQHHSAPVPLDPVPAPLRPLVTAGMAKDPKDRPADAAVFATQLAETVAGAYGPGWENRGRRHLGEAALLLAALWPSAAPPAVQGTAMHQIPLHRQDRLHQNHIHHVHHVHRQHHLRRLLRISPAKAAIAAAVITVAAAGTALASSRPQPPQTPNHPAAALHPITLQPSPSTSPSPSTPPSPSTSAPPSPPPSDATALVPDWKNRTGTVKVCVVPWYCRPGSFSANDYYGIRPIMQSEPPTIWLSGDGRVYAGDITWSGWGNATATGTGTYTVCEHEGPCDDNVPGHAYSRYPATMTISQLSPYDDAGDQAYANMKISVPSAPNSYDQGSHYTDIAPPKTTQSTTTVVKLCTIPALTCVDNAAGADDPSAALKVKPAQISLVADGSIYVTYLTWSGWGDAIATGTGTLVMGGSGNPATVTVSHTSPHSPQVAGGWEAYSEITVTSPASKYTTHFSQGLVP